MIATLATFGVATAAVTAVFAVTPTDPSPSATPTGDPFPSIAVSAKDVELGAQPVVRVRVSGATDPDPSGLVLLDVRRKAGGYHVQRFEYWTGDEQHDVRFALRRVTNTGRYVAHVMFRDGSDSMPDMDRTDSFRVSR